MSSFVSTPPRVIAARRFHVAAIRTIYAALLAALLLAPPVASSDFEFPAISHSWSLLLAAALMALPLLDTLRPRRLLHLDLLVLLAPTIALALEQRARGWPVMLVYPALAYLCVRMLLVCRRRRPGRPARARSVRHRPLSSRWLLAGIAVLLVAHVAWAAGSSVRNDSAEGAVQGASRVLAGQSIYGASATTPSSPHGDVYGPVLYEAYLPLTALLDRRDAARFASLAFELLAALLLFCLATRLRGPTFGTLATYCWLAFPLTFYEDALGFNDGLVAASLPAALLAASSPVRRGAAAALAALGKLSPLVLLPALAAYRTGDDRRARWRFAIGLLAASAIVLVPVLLDTSPAVFVSRTLGFQAGREPADSLWSALQTHYGATHGWLIPVSRVIHGLLVAAAATLAIFSYRLVRRDDLIGLAAVCAAVTIAVEASLSYYSYSYVLWFAPLAILVLLALDGDERGQARTASPVLPVLLSPLL